MSLSTYTPEEVAELFDVGDDALRRWRTSALEGTDLHLPANGGTDRKPAYLFDDIMAFLRRNADYRAKVLAALAPKPAVDLLTYGPGLYGAAQLHPQEDTQ